MGGGVTYPETRYTEDHKIHSKQMDLETTHTNMLYFSNASKICLTCNVLLPTFLLSAGSQEEGTAETRMNECRITLHRAYMVCL